MGIYRDPVALDFIFQEAIENVNRGHISTEDKLYQLKALQEAAKKEEYLNSVRQMEGYGSVVSPHCACDSRKEGRVIPIVSFEGFKLQACKEDGTEEKQWRHKIMNDRAASGSSEGGGSASK